MNWFAKKLSWLRGQRQQDQTEAGSARSYSAPATKWDLEEMQSNMFTTLAQFEADLQKSLAGIQTGIANLQSQIQTLQNSPGTLSADDQATLDSIDQTAASLAAAVTAAPVTPAPAPASGN